MTNYKQFIFDSYSFDPSTRRLDLRYAFDDAWHFIETYTFNFDPVDYDALVLDRAIQHLFFMAGVSYYKVFLADEIVVKQGQIDQRTADFLSKTWQKGLGEFWYLNEMSPLTPVVFPVNSSELDRLTHSGEGQMIGIGGGKDSLVSVELLRPSVPTTWSMNHRQLLTPLIEGIGLNHYWVDREFDKQLLTLKSDPNARKNGHIPVSAIFACAGAVTAILAGRKDNVVSNEHSANEPTLHHKGQAINHQYSKSEEFEQDYQAFLAEQFDDTLRYYSLLRPLSELRIGELFAPYFDRYKDAFSSCNRAFIHGSQRLNWDGECAKCAFVYMILAPHVPQAQLNELFDGQNLLLKDSLVATYKQLLGIEGDKPLDCVGEIEEARQAMSHAQQRWPELIERYRFETNEGYDYKQIYSHQMPKDVWEKVSRQFQQ